MSDDRDHPEGSVPWAELTIALARRPGLWPTALGQMFRLAPRGWWRHAPFLPRPDSEYVQFRVRTQYGEAAAGAAVLVPADVIEYLVWCREVR
ncbi:MAG TPA: hypothetical protein VFF40_10110 [Acidimicrobiia bacterium]|nr:hypothetical protein [Acidimicrobiia bacterium]